jgi:hypothetical protein
MRKIISLKTSEVFSLKIHTRLELRKTWSPTVPGTLVIRQHILYSIPIPPLHALFDLLFREPCKVFDCFGIWADLTREDVGFDEKCQVLFRRGSNGVQKKGQSGELYFLFCLAWRMVDPDWSSADDPDVHAFTALFI